LASKGIELIGGDELTGFAGSERVERVLTAGGREIACDAVVVGAGVRPDTMLAQRAGLEVDDGIVCDSGLETSVEGIFAAGDCCSYESELHGGRLRIEHWDVAFNQGRHAARGMLGDKQPYRVVPYFFSDLSDWAAIESVGPAADWDEVVFRGDPGSGSFSAWYLRDGALAGAVAVDSGEDLQAARRLLESGYPVDPARIADPDADPGSF
jgi:3-phenylpropionate/trans-cinnamate dioxygenase ferredoxin reductase subunit